MAGESPPNSALHLTRPATSVLGTRRSLVRAGQVSSNARRRRQRWSARPPAGTLMRSGKEYPIVGGTRDLWPPPLFDRPRECQKDTGTIP